MHHLSCAHGFNAHVYGFGYAKGYAYLVGSKASNLSTAIDINGISVQSNEVFPYCVEEPITFSAEVNLQNYNLTWDFGDGNTSHSNPVAHVYHDRSVYHASLLVTSDEGGCSGSESDTTKFYIDVTQQYVHLNDEVCEGDLYNEHGFHNLRINNDTILACLQDNPLHPECQDSLLIHITARPTYHTPINDSRCWQGQPGVYDGYGFSFIYDQPGSYDRQLYLTTIHGCDSVLNLHLIVDEQITHEFSHHSCNGSYTWDGRVYNTAGDYDYLYVTPGGCDSIVTLHLTMGTPQHIQFDTITCGTFHWNDEFYETSGPYTQYFTTIDGCDSIVECNLTISGNVEGTTANISTCDSYFWIDEDYNVSGSYDKTLSTLFGCDSIVHLNLDLEYTPDPTDIYPKDPENTAPHWVVTASEFQINDYDFTLWDNNSHCRWDSIVWTFENPDANWVLEPDSTTNPPGKNIKIYVLNQVEDTVWLRAMVYNKCHPQGTERRYWFVCSFYGTDEYESTTSPVTMTVTPNPNRGQMMLNFENLIGDAELKVYDMRGVLIDQFPFISSTDSYAMPYQFKSQAEGLYLFVVSWKNGNLIKKVTIFR